MLFLNPDQDSYGRFRKFPSDILGVLVLPLVAGKMSSSLSLKEWLEESQRFGDFGPPCLMDKK